MNELEEFKKLFTKIYELFDKKVEVMEERLKHELQAKMEDQKLVDEILNAITTIIDIEKKQIPKEQNKAVELIKYQNEQIKLLTILREAISDVQSNPDLLREIEHLNQQIDLSLKKEIEQT